MLQKKRKKKKNFDGKQASKPTNSSSCCHSSHWKNIVEPDFYCDILGDFFTVDGKKKLKA
jgi:hypothetical protein